MTQCSVHQPCSRTTPRAARCMHATCPSKATDKAFLFGWVHRGASKGPRPCVHGPTSRCSLPFAYGKRARFVKSVCLVMIGVRSDCEGFCWLAKEEKAAHGIAGDVGIGRQQLHVCSRAQHPSVTDMLSSRATTACASVAATLGRCILVRQVTRSSFGIVGSNYSRKVRSYSCYY